MSLAAPPPVPQLSLKSVPRTMVFAKSEASHKVPNPVPKDGMAGLEERPTKLSAGDPVTVTLKVPSW